MPWACDPSYWWTRTPGGPPRISELGADSPATTGFAGVDASGRETLHGWLADAPPGHRSGRAGYWVQQHLIEGTA